MCPDVTGAFTPKAEMPEKGVPEEAEGEAGLQPTGGAAPRILIDLTTSWHWKGKHAVGILRTEREIARRLMGNEALQTLPVVFHENAFRVIPREYARGLLETPDEAAPAEAAAQAGAAPSAASPGPAEPQPVRAPFLTRCIRPFMSVARRLVRGGLKLFPGAVAEEVRLSLIHGRQAFRNLLYRPAPSAPPVPPEVKRRAEEPLDLNILIYPGASDVLFVCGLSWDVLNWPIIAEVRRNTGLRIVSVMYDLIPVKFPEFVGGPQPVLQNCFLHMLDNSDLILCISACTEADFHEFVRDNGRPPVPTEIIYLGANVPALPSLASIPDEAARARLASGRFALTVGTFEIRKNYALLVDLWEELLRDPDFDLDLVIVGMPGWLVEDTMKRLKALPGFGTRIHWFNRLSDAGLSWLYENCHVFLFPSLYEGWGLPVAEALLHKSPTIASSRGATPEAAFGQALILDPDDRKAWRAALAETAKAPRRVITFDPANLPSWDQTAATVERALIRVAALPEPPR